MALEAPPFVVIGDRASAEVWSIRRLPFEPKGWQLELRLAMQDSVRNLDGSVASGLRAVYTSADSSPCDVENACMYNIGLGCFRNFGSSIVCVERSYEAPSIPPIELAGPAAHQYEYAVIEAPSFKSWQIGRPIASWTGVALAAAPGPADTWWAMTGSADVEVASSVPGTGHLALRL